MADGLIIAVALIGAWALLFRLKDPIRMRAYARLLMAGLTAYFLAKCVAVLYQPELERPFQQLGQEAGASYLDNPGFPSDHVLFATAITLAVWSESRSSRIAIILAILTALVAVGRVLALVHTPLDVLGGVIIGLVGGIWYLQKPSTSSNSLKKQK